MWWYLFVFLIVAVVFWLIYEWFQHTFIQYKTTIVEYQKTKLNQEMRLCLISDLHNNRKDIKALTKRIAEFSPEVILLAGDMVDKHKTENHWTDNFLAALQLLDIPVYYSAGNHELSFSEKYAEEWNLYLKSLPNNIHFLDNESVLLKGKQKICISGLSLPREFYKKGGLYNKPEELPNLEVPENDFHILLAHHPEYAKIYEKYHANLAVSGHLHGGLLRLPFIGGVISPRFRLPECDAGVMSLNDDSKIFVSRGLGSHTIPLRFFNRVEVNFLILKRTEN